MNYELTINQHNIRPHLDIERDMQEKKDGLFTFTIRVSQGNIEDYAQFETITYTDNYRGCVFVAQKERGFSYDTSDGNYQNAIRPDKR